MRRQDTDDVKNRKKKLNTDTLVEPVDVPDSVSQADMAEKMRVKKESKP